MPKPVYRRKASSKPFRSTHQTASDLDFEIRFFEQLLADKPDFLPALIPLGCAYTQKGLHDRALAVDRRIVLLVPEDPFAWYNLACSLSLLKRLEESFKALRRAIALGYADIGYLRRDPDLHNLRQTAPFRSLLAQLTRSP